MVALRYHALPYSVLVTDDEPQCRIRFRAAFESDGYRTHLASTGTEAIRLVRQHQVHVAVLDMHLPDMSGLEAFGAIREELGNAVPAILVSHDRSKELLLKAMTARFETFLSKPVHLEVLRNAVGRILFRYYEQSGRDDVPT